jgi:hypothetical protein
LNTLPTAAFSAAAAAGSVALADALPLAVSLPALVAAADDDVVVPADELVATTGSSLFLSLQAASARARVALMATVTLIRFLCISYNTPFSLGGSWV